MTDQGDFEHTGIGEGDLLAYLDGDVAPALARHIAHCVLCQRDLVALTALDARFSAALLRADCPSAETLLEYTASLLAPQIARQVDTHLAACADCRAEFALIAAPAALSLAERVMQSGRNLLRAVLLPPPLLATSTLRGAAPVRHHYTAEKYEILLSIVPPLAPGGTFTVEGQLGDAVPGEVRLLRDELLLRSDIIDDLGFFAFDALAPGVYTLQLQLGNSVMQVDALSVGEAGSVRGCHPKGGSQLSVLSSLMILHTHEAEQNALVARLLAAAGSDALALRIAEERAALSMATVAALKQQVDATKLRNAARALSIAEVAAGCVERAHDQVATALALWARGNALYHLSRFNEALAAYRQAEAIYAAYQFEIEVTRLRINQVAVLQDTGAFAEALAVAEAARADCVRLGDAALPFLALLEMNSGAACQQLGRFEEALAAYVRGRAIFVALGDAVQTARIDINRANVIQEAGHFELAAELYAAARITLEHEGMQQEVARADHNLGKLAYRRGRYHEALHYLEVAWSAYAAIPNPLEMAKADLYRALVYRDLNLLDETIELALSAERRFARADTRWERAVALNIAGVGHARSTKRVPPRSCLRVATRPWLRTTTSLHGRHTSARWRT
ncbi:hypothetical protein HC891_22990, partial [Candidatus Gracilibacteria bacterium]|nr:hypothetical protein [Candidatus Gracilibacteria bacterium]